MRGVVSPATYACVGDVSHSTVSVTVVFEQTLHLILLHTWPDTPHYLTVSRTAHLVSVAEYSHFQGGLYHTTVWGVI